MVSECIAINVSQWFYKGNGQAKASQEAEIYWVAGKMEEAFNTHYRVRMRTKISHLNPVGIKL